jgi:hypothetical protein
MQMALVWAQRSYLTVLTVASASQTVHAAKTRRNIIAILQKLNRAGVKTRFLFYKEI